jgi:hypothetical protein
VHQGGFYYTDEIVYFIIYGCEMDRTSVVISASLRHCNSVGLMGPRPSQGPEKASFTSDFLSKLFFM